MKGRTRHVIDLYTWFTPNGRKVSLMLEECGLDYTAHAVNIAKDEQFAPDFLKISPNNKIPAIVDNDNGKSLMESGAIMMYLADKTGKFWPSDPENKWSTVEWLMFQMGGVGPMFGQLGHFYKFAADKITDQYPTDRYLNESRRLLGVLDGRLSDRDYIMGADYTIADIATAPWVRTLTNTYDAGEALGLDGFTNVVDWRDRILSRPAVEKGLAMPPRP